MERYIAINPLNKARAIIWLDAFSELWHYRTEFHDGSFHKQDWHLTLSGAKKCAKEDMLKMCLCNSDIAAAEVHFEKCVEAIPSDRDFGWTPDKARIRRMIRNFNE